MARVELMTLPDEGAADMVRGALNELGIEPQFERVFLEHPFRASILAEPWRVFVPADRLDEAQAAVARLAHDMAEEVETQSVAWSWRHEGQGDGQEGNQEGNQEDGQELSNDGHERHDSALTVARGWRPSRGTIAWALALAILIPLLTIGLYARGRDPHC